jgi:hypothetical protein
MSNSIKAGLAKAAAAASTGTGFEADSTVDVHDFDHGITPERIIGEGEEPSMEVTAETEDREGTAKEHGKLHTGTGSKSPTPFWLNREFTWKMGTNSVTGETFWNLQPIKDVVATCISYCPGIVEDAYSALSDEDKAQATNFGKALRELAAEAEQMDSWLERTAAFAYAKDAAKNAASAVRWTLAQHDAAGRDATQLAIDHGERAAKAGRTAAMLKLALITADSKIDINYKSGAWDLYKSEAYRQAKQFMNPDEEKAQATAAHDGLTAPGFQLRAKA